MPTESLLPYLDELSPDIINFAQTSARRMESYLCQLSSIFKNMISSDNLENQCSSEHQIFKSVGMNHKKIIEGVLKAENNVNLGNLTIPLKVLSINQKEKQVVVQVFGCNAFPWLSKIKFLMPECPDHILKKLCEYKAFIFSDISCKTLKIFNNKK